MAAFILFLASFWEANRASTDRSAELMPNILYAVTSEDVLRAQLAQHESDRALAEYLWRKGFRPDMSDSFRRRQLAEYLLIARDLGGYEYSRQFYLEEAKRCN